MMNSSNYHIMLCILALLSIAASVVEGYTPSANVKAGHRISGKEFSTSPEYLQAVLTTPIALTVLGVLSLIVLNISFCCRNCFKCCRCEPNDHHGEKGHDHDSVSQRMAYINHQKLMVFIVEMVLSFCVLLADMFCFYGYTGIVAGGKDLNDALDLIDGLLTQAVHGATSVITSTGSLNSLISLSETSNCPPHGSQINSDAMKTAYAGLKTLSDATAAAMQVVVDSLGPISSNVADNKNFINDTLLAYADIFVFLVFSVAFISVCLFVIFRLFRSACGTKIAIAWGMLTFLVLLLVCLPFMIFSSIFGDFCMNPSGNAVAQAPYAIRNKLTFYSTCVTSATVVDDVGTNLEAGADKIGQIITDIANNLIGTQGSPGPCYGNSTSTKPVVLNKISSSSGPQLKANILKIREAAKCENVQAIWFKIVNDALCTNFYSGIYSLWVSQFVTSFFLFLLIVQASISYHYFAKSSVYVSAEGAAPEITEKGPSTSNASNSSVEMQKLNDYGDSEA